MDAKGHEEEMAADVDDLLAVGAELKSGVYARDAGAGELGESLRALAGDYANDGASNLARELFDMLDAVLDEEGEPVFDDELIETSTEPVVACPTPLMPPDFAEVLAEEQRERPTIPLLREVAVADVSRLASAAALRADEAAADEITAADDADEGQRHDTIPIVRAAFRVRDDEVSPAMNPTLTFASRPRIRRRASRA